MSDGDEALAKAAISINDLALGLTRAIGMYPIAMYPMAGMEGKRIMCAKNGCKDKYGANLVKSVSLVLCQTHEGALDRVPAIRKLWREKHLADVRTSAFIRSGNADLATTNAAWSLDIEESLLVAALAWSKELDAEPEVVDAPKESWVTP